MPSLRAVVCQLLGRTASEPLGPAPARHGTTRRSRCSEARTLNGPAQLLIAVAGLAVTLYFLVRLRRKLASGQKLQ